MPAIFTLFNILALVYVLRSAQLSVTLWRERTDLRQSPLTPRKKYQSDQAAYFIAVPVSVFFHELAHALTVWLFGGQVIEFGYRFFWGYVQHQGIYTPPERWLIALSGTIGSLLTGLAFWYLLRNRQAPALRYFGLRALRFQIYFSLIYYPLFTLAGFDGDWAIIYNFRATPVLSAATAVAHAAILLLTFRADRRGWFEMPAFQNSVAEAQFDQLAIQARQRPDDTGAQLRYIDALRRSGEERQATRRLHTFLQEHPENAEGHLQLAAVQSQGKREIPRGASENAARALSLGLHTPQQVMYANQLIGEHYLALGQGREAVHAFTDALAAAPAGVAPQDTAVRARLHYARAQGYRRDGQYDSAYRDAQEAVRLAQTAGDKAGEQLYQGELAVIRQHAGQHKSSRST